MTTQEEFARCQQSLLSLYQDLAERMRKDTFHFPTARTGRHRCLDAEYEIAYHRLINLALFHEKQPEAPRQPLRTLDEVVRDLGDPFQPSPDETPLGIDDELPDIETPG